MTRRRAGSWLVKKCEQNNGNQRHHKEDDGHDLGDLGELGFEGAALVFAEEGFGSAGDGTGKSSALAALHKNYGRYSQT